MCNPAIAIAAAKGIAAVASVASTGVAVYSSIQQGKAAEATAEYNARVAENEAQDTRNAATEAENIQRRKTSLLMGEQRAAMGAAGIELGSGSALQIQEDTETLGEVDALRIRSQGTDQVDVLNTQAGLTRMEGSNAVSQSYVNAGSSLLSGASSIAGSGVADKWFSSSSDISSGGGFSTPLALR